MTFYELFIGRRGLRHSAVLSLGLAQFSDVIRRLNTLGIDAAVYQTITVSGAVLTEVLSSVNDGLVMVVPGSPMQPSVRSWARSLEPEATYEVYFSEV